MSDKEEKEKIRYRELGEEDYIGFNITLGQNSPKTLLRTGVPNAEGVAEAVSIEEVVLKMGGIFTEPALINLYLRQQFTAGELGQAMSNHNSTVSRKYEKRMLGAIAPEARGYEEEQGGY